MWLDLSYSDDDKYTKYSVIQQFGHALGLGHEHQRADFWKLVESYIDATAMKYDLRISDAVYQRNWCADKDFYRGKCNDYDPNSIMHFW